VTTVVTETGRSESPTNGSPYDWTAIGEALISLAVIGAVLQASTLWTFHRLSK
jgi:hypothetical protein